MDALKAGLARLFLHGCALLPIAWARALGRLFGRAYWPLGGRSRRVTLRNIEAVFPELDAAQQEQLARRSVCATAELMAEMGHIWLRPWEYVSGLIVAVEGAELITDAQEQGRGVVVLAPHLGNWEVLGLHLTTLGPTVCLYEPPKIKTMGPIMESARQRTGATVVPTTNRGLAKLVRSLKRGDLCGILPDQVPPELHSGENSEFMGVQCFTGTLASNMIRRTGALALFGFAKRVEGGFILEYRAAEPEVYNGDTTVSLAALNRGVEACVRECVEQYQWEYKRFRIRPKQTPGFYDDV